MRLESPRECLEKLDGLELPQRLYECCLTAGRDRNFPAKQVFRILVRHTAFGVESCLGKVTRETGESVPAVRGRESLLSCGGSWGCL